MTVDLYNMNEYASRADEVADLVDSVKQLIIPFIHSADPPLPSTSSPPKLSNSYGSSTRPIIVESHPPKELMSLLNLDLPRLGAGKAGLLDMVQNVLKYSVNTWDQGFMDKLYASTNAVGVVSEMILAALNTNVHVYQVSPVLTLVEKHVSKSLAELFGLTGPHSGGMSQPGGSASNSSSIVIARNTLFPETKTAGIGARRFVLFTSAHGHYSLEKAAQMYGFGSNAVRSVPVDDVGQMDVDALLFMVQQANTNGETPFYVNATAGTTVLGSFDPFEEIAQVCKQHGMWMHVDGSWGGSVIFNRELAKDRLKGVDKADSIAINPHKMLGVPMTCSFLLGQDMRAFWKAMTLPAGYLFHSDGSDDIYDLADLTPQCGRRGDALKMHLSWLYYGSQGFASRIAKAFSLADQLYTLLSSSADFIMVSTRPLPCLQVCFYHASGGVLGDKETTSKRTAEMVVRLINRGFMVDYAPGVKGKFFRVVVSINTTEETIKRLAQSIKEVGTEVP